MRRKPTPAQLVALAKARAAARANRLELLQAQQRWEDEEHEEELLACRRSAAQWARSLLKRHPRRTCLLDTETTGLDAEAQVIQVAIIDPAGEVLLNTPVRPTVPITPGASAIHRRTDDDLLDAPTFSQIYPALLEALAGRLVVAYNAEFDVRVIGHCCGLLELPSPWLPPWRLQGGVYLPDNARCAMVRYAEWSSDWSNWHGDFLWQPLPGGCHEALGDCQALLSLLRRMADTNL